MDIWQQLVESLAQQPNSHPGLGLWEQMSLRPDGLWRNLREETVVLTNRRPGIWHEANEETLILDRGRRLNLWKREVAAAADEERGLWQHLNEETLVLGKPAASIWQHARVRDMASYRPVRAPGWALKKLSTAGGKEYYVLKGLQQRVYLRLTAEQVFLWKLMDGSQSVQDLAFANFMRYGTLSIEALLGFLNQLQTKGFLDPGVDIYSAASQELARHTLGYWVKRVISLLFQSELSIKGVDAFYGAAHRAGGWLLYTWPVQAIMLAIMLAGLPVFVYLVWKGAVDLVPQSGSGLGYLSLLMGQLFAVIAHESAHALTTKHYGRQVRRGGVGLYFGMIAFFMDTTDIWMERRGPRLAVTWAGPYSGFILGGLAGLFVFAGTSPDLAHWLLYIHRQTDGLIPFFVIPPGWLMMAYQFATFCVVISFLNLNPLLKLDGYYLLMDWLEMPMLRERSLAFVRTHLRRKLAAREAFSRDERVFAIFGVLALAWTVVAIYSMVRIYGGMVFGWVVGVLGVTATWAIVALLLAYFVFKSGRRWLARRREQPA